MSKGNDKITLKDIHAAAGRLTNWGRWGPEDEAGTLNNVSAQDIINAARLIRKGKSFSLALNFDNHGPQSGLWGNRFNPIHTMLATGVDAAAGRQASARSRARLPSRPPRPWPGPGSGPVRSRRCGSGSRRALRSWPRSAGWRDG